MMHILSSFISKLIAIVFVFLITIIVGSSSPSYGQTAECSVTSAPTTVNTGQQFTVTLNFPNISPGSLPGIQYQFLNANPPESIQNGTLTNINGNNADIRLVSPLSGTFSGIRFSINLSSPSAPACQASTRSAAQPPSSSTCNFNFQPTSVNAGQAVSFGINNSQSLRTIIKIGDPSGNGTQSVVNSTGGVIATTVNAPSVRGDYPVTVEYAGNFGVEGSCTPDSSTTLTVLTTNLTAGANPCAGGTCDTAFGPISTNPTAFVSKLVTIAISLAGGIALIIMVIGAVKLLMSANDPQKVANGRDMIIAAIAGLLFLIFSVLILRYLGSNLFNFFTVT